MIYGEPGTDPRRSGIGGSEAGAVLGVSPWLSRLGLWELKRGLREPDPGTERMQWGILIEPVVIREYERRTGQTVEPMRLQEHPTYSFMRGIPDGHVLDADNRAQGKLLEVKLTHHVTDEWGEEGSDIIPAHYYAQVQHYMALTDDVVCDVAVLVGGNHLGIWTVPADREFQAAMIEQEREFWESVKTGEPPAPDGSEDARRALRTLYPRAERDVREATDEMVLAMEGYVEANAAIRTWEADKERHAQSLMAYIADHEGTAGGGYRANWSNTAGRTDWKLVAKAYRALLEDPLLSGIRAATDSPDLDTLAALHTAPDGRRLTVKGTDR